ncbi:DNA replication/repair protein RecF [Rhodovibrionaceae bacterium A322]
MSPHDKATWITRLSVTDFRNLRQVDLRCDHRPLLITGENGAGKTNLLEAISLLTPGRGLRNARGADLLRLGSSNQAALASSQSNQRSGREGEGTALLSEGLPWAVAASLETPDGPRDLGTGLGSALDPKGEKTARRRLIKVDGAFAGTQQALGDVLSAVWVTPQMDRIFSEGPASRRRFLDRLVYGFDPSHAGRISGYEQALRDRARLLKAGQSDPHWLGALEENMASRAVAIAAARRDIVSRLAGTCAEAVSHFPRAGIGVAGEVESWMQDLSATEVEERLRDRLAASRENDARLGGAAVGTHRSDLAVRHLDRGMPAHLCSTGEQKALLLSIVLAHGRLVTLERGTTPVLLLDEVAAHLDQDRRDALFEEVQALGAQVWMTAADPGVFAPLKELGQSYQMTDGLLSPGG